MSISDASSLIRFSYTQTTDCKNERFSIHRSIQKSDTYIMVICIRGLWAHHNFHGFLFLFLPYRHFPYMLFYYYNL